MRDGAVAQRGSEGGSFQTSKWFEVTSWAARSPGATQFLLPTSRKVSVVHFYFFPLRLFPAFNLC